MKPYWGVTPSDASQLCFDCHRREVYFTGAEDGVPASTSRFYNDSGAGAAKLLHSWHTQTQGRSCSACHVTHGGTVKALLRSDVGYTVAVDGNGGSCLNGCHNGDLARVRAQPVGARSRVTSTSLRPRSIYGRHRARPAAAFV